MTTTGSVLSFLLCGISLTLVFGADMTIDLRSGAVNNITDVGMTWVTSPYDPNPSSSGDCDWQAVLRLDFKESKAAMAEIRMEFDNPNNVSFHVADSNTNDGWAGGDDGTDLYDAEVFAWNNDLFLYGRDKAKRTGSFGLIGHHPDFLISSSSTPNSPLLVGVATKKFEAEGADGRFVYYRTYKLFRLTGGKTDENPPDSFIFLGMNRVVSHLNPASGSGLCRVEITWLSSEKVSYDGA